MWLKYLIVLPKYNAVYAPSQLTFIQQNCAHLSIALIHCIASVCAIIISTHSKTKKGRSEGERVSEDTL